MKTAILSPDEPARALPALDMDNKDFWTGGKEGELRIYRCQDCEYYIHPPVRFCPKCESRNVEPEAVSGRGTVVAVTVNYKQWVPNLPVPYALALVGIEEQPEVRLVSNILNCEPEEVKIGMPVKVRFEQIEDIWAPFFEPETK